MHVVRGRARLAADLARPLRAPAVAIGNFDGVHRGHQALLAEARARAAGADGEDGDDGDDGDDGEAVVLTFDPHPARFFAPQLAPPMIVPLERRLELLEGAGADVVVIEPFTAELARLEAEAFVEGVLHGELGARHVVVGYDFSFGRGRRGTTGLLAALGPRLGMGVTVVPPVMVDGLVCSSTKIREFVLEGRVEGAKLLLGRPFEITGLVVRGAGRGRALGVPTANLDPEGELLPRAGIYAARARLLGGAALVRPAAVSVGTNPTFTPDSAPLTVEAHLLDFDGDLYGARLRLEIEAHLRDERRFATADELVAQIRRDIARTRELLAGPGPGPT
jgi:riboflavin kinase/FMN adenylyltransferase